jgi:pentatricopeptide repeat protein
MTRGGRAVGPAWLVAAAALAFHPATMAAPPQTVAGTPASTRPVADIVREADQAFAREDFKTARPLYEEAVSRQPDHLRSLVRAGLIESWDGALDLAAEHYRRAVEIAPDDFDARLGLARVLAWSKDYAGSIDAYRTLRAGHPDDPRVLLGLGQALSWAGRFDAADAVFHEMEEKKIEPIQAHAGRARLRGWQGRLDEAAQFWRDVLRAEPGNLDARIGLGWVNHWKGLDRTAREQAGNIVLDHPESKDAQELRSAIQTGLRPYAEAEAFRSSDTDSNQVEGATAAFSFKAEPQTTVRIAYSTWDAEFRCQDPAFCSAPGLVVGSEIHTRAQGLSAAVTSRVVSPITFNAHLGAVREETFDGRSRAFYTLGGFMRLQVGPRFAVGTSGGRDVLVDTAPLIDRGIRVDEANGRVELLFRSAWTLTGTGGLASYSDGNARKTAGAALAWHAARAHPRVSAVFDARWRAFNDDRDNGYFDPLRYASELLTVAISDEHRDGRFYWRLEGTYGRQAFTLGAAEPRDDTVQGGTALAGVNFAAGRAALEASYTHSDYALNVANGFTYSRSGFFFRYRF